MLKNKIKCILKTSDEDDDCGDEEEHNQQSEPFGEQEPNSDKRVVALKSPPWPSRVVQPPQVCISSLHWVPLLMSSVTKST